jgi:hypothetical protein
VTGRYQINGSNVLAIPPGGQNIAVGVNAGTSTTTGARNTFVGQTAGALNTTGNNNTFLGASAGLSNTTGTGNSFLGATAGLSNTTGNSNTFLGASAGFSNTTGNGNSFLGQTAGYFNTTGTYNTYIGCQSGLNETTGYRNTFLGFRSGYFSTTNSSNTFVGLLSGYNNTTGSNNIAIGEYAGYNNETGNNNIAIGSYTVFPSTTSSNRLNIGNVVYGDLLFGNIGIGTDSPTEKFEVNGNIKSDFGVIANTGTFSGDVSAGSIYSHTGIVQSTSAISILTDSFPEQSFGSFHIEDATLGYPIRVGIGYHGYPLASFLSVAGGFHTLLGGGEGTAEIGVMDSTLNTQYFTSGYNEYTQLVMTGSAAAGDRNGYRFRVTRQNAFGDNRPVLHLDSLVTNTWSYDTLVVNSSGSKVGINTGTPSEKLEVNGNIKAEFGVIASTLTIGGVLFDPMMVAADTTTIASDLSSEVTRATNREDAIAIDTGTLNNTTAKLNTSNTFTSASGNSFTYGVNVGSLTFVGDSSIQTRVFAPISVSSENVSSISIASTEYVAITTVTYISIAGRILQGQATVILDNDDGGARAYTCKITVNGVLMGIEYSNNQLASDDEILPIPIFITSTTGGSTDITLWCKSDNAAGTQLARNRSIYVVEY